MYRDFENLYDNKYRNIECNIAIDLLIQIVLTMNQINMVNHVKSCYYYYILGQTDLFTIKLLLLFTEKYNMHICLVKLF